MKSVRAKASAQNRQKETVQVLAGRDGKFSKIAATFTFAAMQYEKIYISLMVVT